MFCSTYFIILECIASYNAIKYIAKAQFIVAKNNKYFVRVMYLLIFFERCSYVSKFKKSTKKNAIICTCRVQIKKEY